MISHTHSHIVPQPPFSRAHTYIHSPTRTHALAHSHSRRRPKSHAPSLSLNRAQRVRDSDAALLKSALGPNATAIIAFHHYLADVGYYGYSPLHKLQQVVEDFSSRGIKPVIFFLDCEFYGAGTWQHTHDVVRNASARSYLLANINRTLSLPRMASVRHASTYWLGESSRCTGRGGHQVCTEAQITDYLSSVQRVINMHAASHLVHLDGQIWEACWPQPCSPDTWGVGGYSPRSLREASVQGVMAESWAQGSLRGAVATLLAAKAVPPSELLLLNDVPNCGQANSSRPCATGTLEGDMAHWFRDLEALGLQTTFGAWDWVDGGLPQPSNYGIVSNDGSTLTEKGKIVQAQVGMLL